MFCPMSGHRTAHNYMSFSSDKVKITLEYFRPFFPVNEEDIRKTKNDNIIVFDSSLSGIQYFYELEIEWLLNEIKREHKISHNIRLISNKHYQKIYSKYQIEYLEDCYDEFVKAGETLIARGKRPFDKDLIDHKKRFNPQIALLIKINDAIEWYICRYREILLFLHNLKEYGNVVIKSILERRKTEGKLLSEDYKNKLINSGPGERNEYELLFKLIESGELGFGEPTFDVPVSTGFAIGKHLVINRDNIGIKRIDLVFDSSDSDLTWIIESKVKLNWKAVGQALCYPILYKVTYYPEKEILFAPPRDIKNGIVCSVIDPAIKICCEQLGIRLFEEKDL